MYPFKLPDCGKDLEWRPLSVRETLDNAALTKGQTPAEMVVQELVKRIRRYDGKDGPPSAADWGAWSDIDLEFFQQEVNEKEGARRAAFRKRQEGGSSVQQAKMLIDTMKETAAQFILQANAAIEALLVAERASDPTKSG